MSRRTCGLAVLKKPAKKHLPMSLLPRSGYALMSAIFIGGLIDLIVAALFHRLAGAAILVAGLLFVTSGLMVATDAVGAGGSFLRRYSEWLHRWFPWYQVPQPDDHFLMVFTGGLAAAIGVIIAIAGALVLVGRFR